MAESAPPDVPYVNAAFTVVPSHDDVSGAVAWAVVDTSSGEILIKYADATHAEYVAGGLCLGSWRICESCSRPFELENSTVCEEESVWPERCPPCVQKEELQARLRKSMYWISAWKAGGGQIRGKSPTD